MSPRVYWLLFRINVNLALWLGVVFLAALLDIPCALWAASRFFHAETSEDFQESALRGYFQAKEVWIDEMNRLTYALENAD